MPGLSSRRHTADKFYHLAKEQGYRSRAAFKLVQLNKKYDFLSKASSLLDLCAAPGGWLQARGWRGRGPTASVACVRRLAPWLTRSAAVQVAHKYMPLSSTIVGVDLVPIRPIRGVVTLTEDITTAKCRAAVKRCLPPGGLFDVVICDGAPNVGGAWSAEAYTQAALVLEACKLACDVLAPNGLFITKVFRSAEYHALLYTFHQLFERVESTKPLASRSTSAEIYVACIGYRAPGKLDKRLLDPQHLFASTEGGAAAGDAGQGGASSGKPSVLDVPDGETRRNRGGYDTTTGTLFAFGDAEADFVSNDKAVEALGAFTLFRIAPGSELDKHEATTGEVRSLISDLRVLGKRDFRALLKWRDLVRCTRAAEAKAAAAAAAEGDASKAPGDDDGVDEEDKLLAEMEGVRERAERRKRREKKTKAKAKTKARVRAALGANGDASDVYGHDNELFALKRVTGGAAGLERVADKATGDSDDDSEDELRALAAEQSDEDEEGEEEDGGDGEEDPDRVADEVLLNRELDAMYAAYATRRGLKHTGEVTIKRRSRASLKDPGELGGGVDVEDGDADFDWRASGKDLAQRVAASAAEKAASRNPLVLPGPKGKAPAGSLADVWFSNPVFDDIIRGSGKGAAPQPAKAGKRKKAVVAEEDDDEENDAIRSAARAAARGWDASGEDEDARPAKARGRGGAAARGDDAGFEIVPQRAEAEDSDSDSDRSTSYDREMDETLDDGTKAEIRAMGRLLMKRKTREAVTEEGYHKWTSGSQEELPPWFAADEARHCRRNLPVTAAEVAAEKAALRALDARPIKKVAEARARKKKKLAVRMDQARAQANAIADQEDVPLASRMRQIERVYAKSRRGKGGPAAKGGKGGKDTKTRLDPRMRKDQRQVGSKKKKETAKRKGKGGGKGGGGKKR